MLFAAVTLAAQRPGASKADAAKPAPDVVVFVNGEQLSGELERANGDGITFKSAMAGEITVKWKNVKELHSAKSFALIGRNAKLTRRDALALVPQGAVAADRKDITIAGKTIPVANTSLLIPDADFAKAINRQPSLLHGWIGTATGGVSLVRSTQDTTTFSGGCCAHANDPDGRLAAAARSQHHRLHADVAGPPRRPGRLQLKPTSFTPMPSAMNTFRRGCMRSAPRPSTIISRRA